jgi:hypothetical protein
MHLFAVDPLARDLRDLIPLPEVTAHLGNSSHVVPGRVALLLNDRDRRWHDVYSLDPVTGERTLIWENTQNLAHIGLDWQLRPRFASGSAPDGSSLMIVPSLSFMVCLHS